MAQIKKQKFNIFFHHLCWIKKLGSFTPEMKYRLFDLASRRVKLVKGGSKISAATFHQSWVIFRMLQQLFETIQKCSLGKSDDFGSNWSPSVMFGKFATSFKNVTKYFLNFGKGVILSETFGPALISECFSLRVSFEE